MSKAEVKPTTVLIVDDDPSIRRLFRAVLARDWNVVEADSGAAALELAPAVEPAVVLLDVQMPGLSGYRICRQLKSIGERPPQVIMVSARSTQEEQLTAFDAGADDYLVKPVDPCDLRSRVHLHLNLRESKLSAAQLQIEIDDYHSVLRRTAVERTEQIVAVQDAAVFTLAKVAESRNNETGTHLLRLREYAQILADDLSHNSPYSALIDEGFLADLYRSSPLHDIGKVGVPDNILLKPSKLTPTEFEIMKRHTVDGANILNDAVMQLEGGGFLAMAAVIAQFHHEHWDGLGYLAGLVGDEIPLPARIVAVADVYDALTSERPYKVAWSPALARRAIEDASGTQFDPVIVDSFRRRFDDFLRIPTQHNDLGPLARGAMAFAEAFLAEAP